MRNRAIDIQKGLGIILVAVGHNWVIGQNNDELFRIIYSFHVPLFFFISGVLFQSNVRFIDLIRQKWQSILKPYFTVLLVVSIFVAISLHRFPIGNLIGILFGTGQSILWTPMWFLPSLFVTVIFSWFLISFFDLKNRKNLAFPIIGILLIAGIFTINFFHSLRPFYLGTDNDHTANLIGLPFSIDLLLINTAYFTFGYIISNHIKNYQFNLIFSILSLTLFAASHYFFNETMNLNYRIYGSPVISTLQAVCGIYLIVIISEIIKKYLSNIGTVLSYIGSGSLFILIFHGICQGSAIYKYQIIFQNYGLISGLIGLIAGITCSLLIWEVVKRVPIASALLLPHRETITTKSQSTS